MKAFLFSPSNQFKDKVNVVTKTYPPEELKVFLTNGKGEPYDYIECEGKTWTILSGSNGLELADGKIPRGSTRPVEPVKNLPISTNEQLHGCTILETKGIVFGEAIMGANVLRDIAANFTDFFGGRSGAYESKLKQGRSIALQEMMMEAHEGGANAVVGVKLDYETIGASMLMICATGTGVVIQETEAEQ